MTCLFMSVARPGAGSMPTVKAGRRAGTRLCGMVCSVMAALVVSPGWPCMPWPVVSLHGSVPMANAYPCDSGLRMRKQVEPGDTDKPEDVGQSDDQQTIDALQCGRRALQVPPQQCQHECGVGQHKPTQAGECTLDDRKPFEYEDEGGGTCDEQACK